MTKKALKRVIKKKQVKKKGLRKHLSQNPTQQDQTPQNNSMQNLRQNMIPSNNPNNLRSQLMANTGMSPLFGMGAQQYGNINNERNIRDAQQRGQTLTDQTNNDKRTINELEERNKQLEKETKQYKKQIKDKKHEVEKKQTERDIAKDNLDESKRVDLQMEKLTNEMKNLTIQSSEQIRKNNIVKFKTDIETKEAELHKLKMENQELQNAYESNHYYQELEKVKAEVEMYTTQNQAMQNVINSPDFTKPNEALIQQYKELEKQRYENEILQQQRKAQKDLIDAQIASASMPTKEDLHAKMTEVAADIKQKNLDKINLEYEMYENQKTLNEYNYNIEKRANLDKDILELNNERNRLQEQASKLDNLNKGELGKEVKKKLEIKARVEVENEQKKRRIKRAHDTLEMKEENYKNEQIINTLENGSIDETTINNLVTLEGKNQLSSEKIQTLMEHRNAQAAKSKAIAEQAWLNSNECRQLTEQNVKLQNEVNTMNAATEKMQTLNALKKKAAESAYILQYTTESVSQEDTSLANQISFLQSETDKLTTDVQQRTAAFSHLKTLMNENPTITQEFFSQFPAINNALNTLGANLSLEKLNEYTAIFNKFVQDNPEYRDS